MPRSVSSTSTKSYDSYTNYSNDSFVSEDESHRGATRKSSKDKTGKSTLTKKNVTKAYGKNKKGPGGPGGRTSKASKQTGMAGGSTPRENDFVAKRMLSARRLKINELKNEVETLTQQLIEIQQENKSLRRQHVIQEKALEKYEFQETDLPHIMQRHNEEVRTLREQIKRQKEKSAKLESRMKDSLTERDRLNRQLKKMKSVIENKQLGERDDLSRRLTQVENDFEDKDKRVKDLERHIEHLQKNHKHEIGIERARHRETQRKLLDLQSVHEKTAYALREKEKELDVRNIYSNRVVRPPHKLNSAMNSARSSPLNSRESLPPPGSRERRFDRRRKDKKPLQLLQQQSEPIPESHTKPEEKVQQSPEPTSSQEENTTPKSTYREDEDERRREEEERRKREEEEDEDRRWQEQQREQRKREAEERRKAEEERKRQERERQEREKQEEEERERREKEEVERKAEEERQRIANDVDEKERLRQKELLLAKMKAIDENKPESDEFSPGGTRKNYQFTQPTKNLHNGLPTHDSPSRQRPSFLDDDNSYDPTLTGSGRQRKKGTDSPAQNGSSAKKSNLLNNLFGSEPANKNKSNDDEEEEEEAFFETSPKNKRKTDNNRRSATQGSKQDDRQDSAKLLPRRQQQSASMFSSRPAVNAVDDIDDDIEEVIL